MGCSNRFGSAVGKIFIVLFVSICGLAVRPAAALTDTRGITVKALTTAGATRDIKLYSGYHALVVGCGDYRAGWPRLPNPVKDAREVAAALKGMGCVVNLLEDPDWRTLRRALNTLITGPGRDENRAILFWFSGHGHTLKEAGGRELGYIVPIDAPNPDRDEIGFMEHAISMRQIETLAMRIHSRHALMLFDSCFSGAIFQAVRSKPSPYIEEKVLKPVRQFITAGSEDEQVPDQSVFKTVFIQGVGDGYADRNKDGYVTGMELGDYLQEQVVNYSRGAQHPQFGKINDPMLDKGDFVFLLAGSGGGAAIPAPPTAGMRSRISNRVGMEFVYIAPGAFIMGSPLGESGRDDDERRHRVTLTRGYYMQTTEVTQGQWQAVMGNNPSRFSNCGDDCPVESVSWNDVQAFIRKLNQMEGTDTYRLPTEAEWEYACRAGSQTALYTGEIRILGRNNAPALDPIAWYGGNGCVNYSGGYDCSGWPEKQFNCSTCGIHPVAKKAPNAWGLHDMIGNVWEWCGDWYGDYPTGSATDPEGPSSGADRVNRGGSWDYGAGLCRSAKRYKNEPGYRGDFLGFRLAGTLNAEMKESTP